MSEWKDESADVCGFSPNSNVSCDVTVRNEAGTSEIETSPIVQIPCQGK